MTDAVDEAPASRQTHHTKSRVLIEAKRLLPSALWVDPARMRTGLRDHEQRPLGGRAKRAFDVVLASTALALSAPIMLLAMALIRFFMGRPVIAAEPRIGFKGKVFSSYKFRTITRARQETPGDLRIACLDHVLRNSGLGELPQLFNILRGDMSFVGPRPMGPDASCDHWYLKARPGLTGMWRVGGRIGGSARIACNRHYARRWSLWLDLVLLIRAAAELQNFREPA